MKNSFLRSLLIASFLFASGCVFTAMAQDEGDVAVDESADTAVAGDMGAPADQSTDASVGEVPEAPALDASVDQSTDTTAAGDMGTPTDQSTEASAGEIPEAPPLDASADQSTDTTVAGDNGTTADQSTEASDGEIPPPPPDEEEAGTMTSTESVVVTEPETVTPAATASAATKTGATSLSSITSMATKAVTTTGAASTMAPKAAVVPATTTESVTSTVEKKETAIADADKGTTTEKTAEKPAAGEAGKEAAKKDATGFLAGAKKSFADFFETTKYESPIIQISIPLPDAVKKLQNPLIKIPTALNFKYNFGFGGSGVDQVKEEYQLSKGFLPAPAEGEVVVVVKTLLNLPIPDEVKKPINNMMRMKGSSVALVKLIFLAKATYDPYDVYPPTDEKSNNKLSPTKEDPKRKVFRTSSARYAFISRELPLLLARLCFTADFQGPVTWVETFLKPFGLEPLIKTINVTTDASDYYAWQKLQKTKEPSDLYKQLSKIFDSPDFLERCTLFDSMIKSLGVDKVKTLDYFDRELLVQSLKQMVDELVVAYKKGLQPKNPKGLKPETITLYTTAKVKKVPVAGKVGLLTLMTNATNVISKSGVFGSGKPGIDKDKQPLQANLLGDVMTMKATVTKIASLGTLPAASEALVSSVVERLDVPLSEFLKLKWDMYKDEYWDASFQGDSDWVKPFGKQGYTYATKALIGVGVRVLQVYGDAERAFWLSQEPGVKQLKDTIAKDTKARELLVKANKSTDVIDKKIKESGVKLVAQIEKSCAKAPESIAAAKAAYFGPLETAYADAKAAYAKVTTDKQVSQADKDKLKEVALKALQKLKDARSSVFKASLDVPVDVFYTWSKDPKTGTPMRIHIKGNPVSIKFFLTREVVKILMTLKEWDFIESRLDAILSIFGLKLNDIVNPENMKTEAEKAEQKKTEELQAKATEDLAAEGLV